MTVTGPSKWKYIHNTYSENESETNDGLTRVEFKETALFSTYIFALVVGPHEMWEDSYNDIPLRIYCRKSLAKHLDPENIFDIIFKSKIVKKVSLKIEKLDIIKNTESVGIEVSKRRDE